MREKTAGESCESPNACGAHTRPSKLECQCNDITNHLVMYDEAPTDRMQSVGDENGVTQSFYRHPLIICMPSLCPLRGVTVLCPNWDLPHVAVWIGELCAANDTCFVPNLTGGEER